MAWPFVGDSIPVTYYGKLSHTRSAHRANLTTQVRNKASQVVQILQTEKRKPTSYQITLGRSLTLYRLWTSNYDLNKTYASHTRALNAARKAAKHANHFFLTTPVRTSLDLLFFASSDSLSMVGEIHPTTFQRNSSCMEDTTPCSIY